MSLLVCMMRWKPPQVDICVCVCASLSVCMWRGRRNATTGNRAHQQTSRLSCWKHEDDGWLKHIHTRTEHTTNTQIQQKTKILPPPCYCVRSLVRHRELFGLLFFFFFSFFSVVCSCLAQATKQRARLTFTYMCVAWQKSVLIPMDGKCWCATSTAKTLSSWRDSHFDSVYKFTSIELAIMLRISVDGVFRTLHSFWWVFG